MLKEHFLPNWYFGTSSLNFRFENSKFQNLLEFERTSGHKTAGFWVNHSTIGMFHDLTHCWSGECGAKGQRAGSCPRDAWFM